MLVVNSDKNLSPPSKSRNFWLAIYVYVCDTSWNYANLAGSISCPDCIGNVDIRHFVFSENIQMTISFSR